MSKADIEVLTGVAVDDAAGLTLAELCSACTVHAERVVELVEEGVLEPRGDDARRWRFPSTCLRRVRVAIRLQTDLGVNLQGVALALQLMDEMDALQRQLGHVPRSFLGSRGTHPEDADLE